MYTNKLHSRSNKSTQNVCKINMYGRRVLRTITSYYTYYKRELRKQQTKGCGRYTQNTGV